MSQILTTPLTQWHHTAKAKMAPFAGWDMPIQYTGIVQEHNHTRGEASIFDICHMGELLIEGANAQDALASILTMNFATLKEGRCRYGFLLTPQGGVLDDLIVYKYSEEKFMLVVNASRTEPDREWVQKHLPAGVTLTDISTQTGKIDLQGPKALEVLDAVVTSSLAIGWKGLPYFGFAEGSLGSIPVTVSRTGYTGELGYELYVPWEHTLTLWETLLAIACVQPAGLGARDTLRLEAGLLLYGQDIDTEHTPAEAGYSGMLNSAATYIGKGKDAEVTVRLLPLHIAGRRSARHGDSVALPSGEEVGVITSGSFAPSLGHSIAYAYVQAAHASQTEFIINAARSTLPATVCSLPFYTQGTARIKF